MHTTHFAEPPMRFASRQSPPLEGTATGKDAIARVKYTHDAMIDLIVAQPGVKQGEIAKYFGYTQAWVSRIMNSDAFLARLAQRKADLVELNASWGTNYASFREASPLIATMLPGVRPNICLAARPTCWITFLPLGPPSWRIATTDGSFNTMP